MAILPIRTYGDPVLRTPTREIDDIDANIRKLAADMIETMYDAPGVGLAAPQIGVSLRIAVFDAQDGLGARVLVNPRIVELGPEPYTFDEGCLSVPGHWWEITRPAYARVEALDLDGSEVSYDGEELMGRVLQHEVDHLEGILLVERLERREKKRALKTLREEAIGT